jgi:hypothetical protein
MSQAKLLSESFFLELNEGNQQVVTADFPVGNIIIHNNTNVDMFLYFGDNALMMGNRRADYSIEKFSFATVPMNFKHKKCTIVWTQPDRYYEGVRVDLTNESRPFFIQKNSPITGEDLPKSAGGLSTLRWTVGDAPIILAVGDTAHPFRKSIVVKNISVDKVIYIGESAETVFNDGFPIDAGESMTFDTNNSVNYYVVSATADIVDIAIMELF